MSANALDAIVAECGESLVRVGDLLASDGAGRALLARLGWRVSALPAPLLTLGGRLSKLRPLIAEARARPDTPEVWVSLSSAVVGLIDEIRNLERQTFDND